MYVCNFRAIRKECIFPEAYCVFSSVCVCVTRSFTRLTSFFKLYRLLRAGGWSVLQMSPANEDASVAL